MSREPQTGSALFRRTIVFVLGMGRSGTSALTRVLSLCGGALPSALVGATEGNPLGHWEPQDALHINDTFLSRQASTWYDPTLCLQSETTFSTEQCAELRTQIEAFLHTLPVAPLVIIKEPRVTVLSQFWFEAAQRTGFSVATVIPVRHPQEVAASLAARDRVTAELSSALWLKNNLLAERGSRALPRVFVEYTSLLRNWRAEISRIAVALSVDLSTRDEAAVDVFLRQDLRRQRHHGPVSEDFAHQWISRVYSVLSAAARDQAVDTGALDEVYDAYRACEYGFRTAFDDFRMRFGPTQIGRKPYVTKLLYTISGGDSEALRACLNSPWYREHNPDVFAARCDPYSHWMTYGAAEGRLPCADPLTLLDSMLAERVGGGNGSRTDKIGETRNPIVAPAAL